MLVKILLTNIEATMHMGWYFKKAMQLNGQIIVSKCMNKILQITAPITSDKRLYVFYPLYVCLDGVSVATVYWLYYFLYHYMTLCNKMIVWH